MAEKAPQLPAKPLTKPLTAKQIRTRLDKHGRLAVVLAVSPHDLVQCGTADGLNDYAHRHVVADLGGILLSDLEFLVVGHRAGRPGKSAGSVLLAVRSTPEFADSSPGG